MLGYEAKLRPERDTVTNQVILGDPGQTALNSGTINAWLVYVKMISEQHRVYLQVWRPLPEVNMFALVGQTYFQPDELRFQELPLQPNEFININKGDVLGLYFPNENPIGYSRVPCAARNRKCLTVSAPKHVEVGSKFKFRLRASGDSACRQYSFSAKFGKEHLQISYSHAQSQSSDFSPNGSLNSQLPSNSISAPPSFFSQATQFPWWILYWTTGMILDPPGLDLSPGMIHKKDEFLKRRK